MADIECVFVCIRSKNLSLIIGAAYIPPNQPNYKYERFCDAVEEVVSSNQSATRYILMGDFNLPNTTWDDLLHCSPGISSQSIINLANLLQLSQRNFIRNHRNVILDLVFSSYSDLEVRQAEDWLVPPDTHHPPLSFNICVNSVGSTQNERYVSYDYKRANINAITEWIQKTSYPTMVLPSDVEAAFTNFCGNLADTIELNTPYIIRKKEIFPRWFNSELKNLVIMKKKTHKEFKVTGELHFYERFRVLRSQCKLLAKKCYDNYTASVEAAIPNNSKVFWAHVGNLTKKTPNPTSLRLNGAEAEDPYEQCELFARFFSSVYKEQNLPPPANLFIENCQHINNITVSAVQVERKLKELDPNKGMGPDFIPPAILKQCCSILAPHITVYFNMLLAAGIFPACLKQSYVTPIYKSGDRRDVTNYRPIAIQSTLAKIFESLVLDVLEFEFKAMIAHEQHGFRKGRSTVTNLVLLQNYIISAFSQHDQVDCILLDFSKAFDRVNHKLLLSKLEGYGITGPLLRWLESYLGGRGMIVKFAGTYSKVFPVLSGVPQGSHLAPFLFLLFVNDICRFISSRYLKFADDIKIFLRVSSLLDCMRLQESLNNILTWCQLNGMDLNIKKCAILTYTRSLHPIIFNYSIQGVKISRVDKFRDLGVIMSSNLSPWEHISHICSKASSLLGLLVRASKDFKSPNTIILLYKTIVRPILEYASVVWNPYQLGHIDALEKIQTRLIRHVGVRIGYNYLEVPVRDLLENFNLLPLNTRRKLTDLLLLHKIINGDVDCPEILEQVQFRVPTNTRSRDIFVRRASPSTYSYHSVIPRLLREGNEVPSEIDFFGTKPLNFKKALLQVI